MDGSGGRSKRVCVWAGGLAFLLALGGCGEGYVADGNRIRAAEAERREANRPRETCHDCDGAEGIVDNMALNRASAQGERPER